MRLLPLALAISLATACSKPAIVSPTAVVDSLYRIRAPIQTSGAPTPAELAHMAPYLSAELHALLVQADQARARETAAHSDEKPAFADGDLFTSLFEGPGGFDIIADSVVNAEHRITVRFTSAAATPPQTWTDRVLVREEGARFVVADVQYGGSWEFASKGSLVESLKAALQGGS